MRRALLMAGGVVALAVPDILSLGIMEVLLISVFISAFFLIREERAFCLLCAGIPSAIMAGPVRGMLIMILLTGILLTEEGLLSERRELPGYIAFSGVAALSALVFGIFRHAGLPLIIIGVLVAGFALLIRVSEYRLKWRYEHEEPEI